MLNRPDASFDADLNSAHPREVNRFGGEDQLAHLPKPAPVDSANAKTAEQYLPVVAITGGGENTLNISSSMHHGPRPEDNYRVEKLAQGKYRVLDPKPHEMLDSPIVKVERERLLNDAKTFIHGSYDTRFVADMVRFEDRSRGKLTEPEVVNTYKQVARLLEQRSTLLGKDDMKRLARDVMLHAATPGSVDQGDHGTCAVTAIESRMYAMHPSEAVRLVADIATTGRYVAGDSTAVTLQKSTIQPDSEAQSYRHNVGVRSHATQLFNIVANNLHYANTNWRYESPKTGEIVRDYSLAPPKKSAFPGLNSAELLEVNEKILGRPEPDAIVSNTLRDAKHAGLKVTSEQDLETTLADLKMKNRLPVMVEVDTSSNPLWTDQGGGYGGGHVVTVTDYIPGSPSKVLVDNQWGAPKDHQYGAAIKLHDFYMTTLSEGEALTVLETDAQTDKAAGVKNYSRDFDIVRHYYSLGDLTNQELGAEVAGIAKEMSKSWAHDFSSKSLNREEFNRDKAELRLMIDTELTPENRLPVLNVLRNATGFSAKEFDTLMGRSLHAIDRAYTQAPVHRAKVLSDYRALIDTLPASRRAEIFAIRIQKTHH